jgi:hypothetical protein
VKIFALTLAEASAIPIYVEAVTSGGSADGSIWTGGQSAAQSNERLVLSDRPGKFEVSCTLGGVVKRAIIYVVGAKRTDFRGDRGGSFHGDNIAMLTRKDKRTFAVAGRKTGRNSPVLGGAIDFNDFCETQYTLEPAAFVADANAGLFNKDKVRFIVAREKMTRAWLGDVDSGTWVPLSADPDWTDDTDVINSMLNPWSSSGHLYSNDGPGLMNMTLTATGIVFKHNLRELVQATFDGSDPKDGHSISGSRFHWHDFRSLRKSSIMWMETDSFGGNELAAGEKPWGAIPD